MTVHAAKIQMAAGAVGTFGGITTGKTRDTSKASVPEFLSFTKYTRRGNKEGAAAFAAISDDFPWPTVPEEPKTAGNNLDLTEGQ